MTTPDEMKEFLEELSVFGRLAEQAGVERPLLQKIEVLKNLVETTGQIAWHQMAWRAQRRDEFANLSLAALRLYRLQQASVKKSA